MSRDLKIYTEWESLSSGSEEERACFAAIGVQAHGIWLSEGSDVLTNRLRQKPLLSGYHFAEWLAWNWWRLRWEPGGRRDGWGMSHRMSSIGGGYIWPDITIFSDGRRTALIARATPEREGTPFRYIVDQPVIVSSTEFEAATDEFMEQVLARLEDCAIAGSNLEKIWNDVCNERQDPHLAQLRKLEALLGFDPEEADTDVLNQLISDAGELGFSAVEELAANYRLQAENGNLLSAQKLREIAAESGFKSSISDMVTLSTPICTSDRMLRPAWQVGSGLAKALREQESLGADRLSDNKLTEMLAVDHHALERNASFCNAATSFALAGKSGDRVVLRSKWREGRRFALARILGDHLLCPEGVLYSATESYTYRQKAQRSFAAELLSPFAVVMDLLNGDYSQENQEEVAREFDVSPMTIETQLVNHHIIERDGLAFDSLQAA